MKKWQIMLCGVCMAMVLTACGGVEEEDIQRVEQEDLSETSQAENMEASTAEVEIEAPEESEEMPESEPAGISEGKPAVVTIETEEQEYKEGEILLLTSSYDHVTVTVEGNEAATKAIMAEFEKREASFQESLAESLEWAKENQVGIEMTISHDLGQGYEAKRNDDRVLSFSSMTGGYEGGAHGYYMEYGINFDTETGQLLSIADITEDKAAFQKISVQEMLRQFGELKKQGIVFDEEMIPPSLQEVLEGKMEGEEWYFTEEGIRFISNIYEIAPYAAGEITFDIPYGMVNDVLKERYRGL